MRLRALAPLVLLLIAVPARAAIQFLGHGTNATGVVARGDWSSDLGPPWIASRPIGNLTHGVTIEADTTRNLTGGSVTARSTLTVAPAGPATSAAPVLVYEGQITAQNLGNLYGRTGASQHSACVRFTPPGAGQTVHFAVRWRLTGSSSGSTMLQYRVAAPFVQIATQASPDSGTYFGTVAGTASGLCNFDFSLDAGVASTANGAIDRTLRVEVYLDSQPLAGVESGELAGIEFAAPHPNPARGTSVLAYTLPSPADVQLVVTDVAGRVVRTLERGARAAGRATLTWDGRDERAEALPAGVYFAKLAVERSGRRAEHTRAVVRMR